MPDSPQPTLQITTPAGPVSAVALVLHGGSSRSHRRVRWSSLAHLRMLPFARDLSAHYGEAGLAVWVLRYRYRGWNAPELPGVADARWALREIAREHPGAPVAIIGHSMGGRVGLRVADEPNVVSICGLAPWIEPGEPYKQLRDRTVLIAHGDREHMTDPAMSFQYAVDARTVTERICRFDVFGSGHAMLRRAADWTALVTRFVAGSLGLEPEDPEIANAMQKPAPQGLRVPLSGVTQ
ncbi:alpha/beta fold hydrolase [Pseudonocardiaceae bacterium YIM PH 21723]|nr:alpha/beta fold hydrolase [Pseudonocardiaceae bacterium YIM PH 21723]